MSEAGKVQIEIDRVRDQIAKVEKKSSNANTQTTIGLLGIVIGVVLIWLGGGIASLSLVSCAGGILALAGLLAILTNITKRNAARTELATLESQLERRRKELSAALDK